MKKKSIELLESFLDNQIKDFYGFKYKIEALDNYDDYWFLNVMFEDCEESRIIELSFKVEYKAEVILLQVNSENDRWEIVSDDNNSCKFFWYVLYCLAVN